MNIRTYVSIKVIVITTVIIIACSISAWYLRPMAKADNTIVVGMMSGWAPFMTIDEQGAYRGFDVDVAEELARRIDKKIIIQDLGSLASCFIALDQGKVDMLFSGLDITKQRLEKLSMVQYTGENTTSLTLIFWKEIPASVKCLEDIASMTGAMVCAEPGSAQEKYLNQFQTINKKPLAAIPEMILDIKFSKSLAALLEPRIAARLAKQNPEIKMLSVPLPPDFQIYGCGIALKKNNQQLTGAVRSAIEQMKADGAIKKLELQWQLEE